MLVVLSIDDCCLLLTFVVNNFNSLFPFITAPNLTNMSKEFVLALYFFCQLFFVAADPPYSCEATKVIIK